MKNFAARTMAWATFCCVTIVLSKSSAAGSQSTAPHDQTTAAAPDKDKTASKSPGKPAAKGGASDSEIAAAKASGKVWVNTDTGVYHKGGRWYGKTKTGKFMTAGEARAAGYREGKR